MGNDDAKRLILARRARFIAAALAGVTSTAMVVGAEACGGQTDAPIGSSDAGASDGSKDASPKPCLEVDAEPQPCLAPRAPDDGGTPRPCLEPPMPEDAGPQPCLAPLPPDGG